MTRKPTAKAARKPPRSAKVKDVEPPRKHVPPVIGEPTGQAGGYQFQIGATKPKPGSMLKGGAK